MSINFPNSPSNGDTHVSGGKTFKYDSTKGVWDLQGSSSVFDPASVSESLIPDTNETYDLGSNTNKFRDLYLSGNSITLGSVELSDNNGSLEVTPVSGGGSAEPFATETYVTTQVNNLVDAAPGALDTLNELAAALGDDANFSTTVTNSLANKADTSSLATVATSGSYNDLTNKPTIPTNNNQLTNGAGYVTSAQLGGDNTVLSYSSTSSASANDVMMLNTDGTVTPVEVTTFNSNFNIANSGSAHPETADANDPVTVGTIPDNRNMVIHAYHKSGHLHLRTASYTGTTITYGSEIDTNLYVDRVMIFVDEFDTSKFILFYTKNAFLYARSGEIVGTSIQLYDNNGVNNNLSYGSYGGGDDGLASQPAAAEKSHQIIYGHGECSSGNMVLYLHYAVGNSYCVERLTWDSSNLGAGSTGTGIDSNMRSQNRVYVVNNETENLHRLMGIQGALPSFDLDPRDPTKFVYSYIKGTSGSTYRTAIRAGTIDWTAKTSTRGNEYELFTRSSGNFHQDAFHAKVRIHPDNSKILTLFSVPAGVGGNLSSGETGALNGWFFERDSIDNLTVFCKGKIAGSSSQVLDDLEFPLRQEQVVISHGSTEPHLHLTTRTWNGVCEKKILKFSLPTSQNLTHNTWDGSTTGSSSQQNATNYAPSILSPNANALVGSTNSGSFINNKQKAAVVDYHIPTSTSKPLLTFTQHAYVESNLDKSKIHGLAASSGTTPDVTTQFGVHSGLSGLTVGSKYYVLDDGTLSTTPDTHNAKIGVAVKSTHIALDFIDELTESDLTTYATKSYVATQTFSGNYADLSNTPSLATVATSGSYNDLSNKPTIPTAVDQTANVLSGASPQIDLTKNYFKIDLSSDTTFSTTGSPTNGDWYEGKIEVKGNASQLTHNLITNPSNQISGWRTTSSTPSISGFYGQGYSIYGFFAVSPNGQYAINGAYVGTGDYKFQIVEFSTPGDITTGSLVHQSGNVHGTLGWQRSNVYFATNTKFVTSSGHVITMPSGSISSSNPYGTLPSTSTAGQGNWSSDGTKYIGVVEAQNQDPIFKLYTASTPFYANTLTLSDTYTLNRWGISGDHPLKIDHGNNVHISDDGLNIYTAGFYQSNNWSNQMIMHFTLSTAFDLSTMTYTGNNLTGSYATFGHGRFIEGGAQYWAPKSNGVYAFQNLNTPAVLNTTTWPGTWSWEGGVSQSAPPNNETDIINFVSTDGGSTFNAWVEKDSDKSAGFDGQYSSLTGAPTLATVATSGSYNDLSNQPTIPSISGLATETYVNTQISNLVDSAPATLDTLNELAAALGDDANFSTTITNQIAAKADAYSIAPVTVSGGKYYIDGEQQVILTLQPGRTYRFDQSDASNNSHPLRFSEIEDGTHAGGGATEYTTGVTVNGTAGNSGAYVEIEVTHATPRLYYYCGNHSGMGGKVSVGKEMFVERITSDTWITGPIQTSSVNVGTGGAINASTATLDFTHTLVNFSGANVGGLGDTIQDEVDFHLNKSNSGGQTIISDGQVLSWNATGGLQGTGDYEWVAQSGGGGSASIEISETAPSSPTAGTMWFDSSVGKTFIYYNDGNTTQWVQMNPSTSGTLTVGSSAPASPSTGEQWYNTNDGALYIYYNDGDSSQWVGVSGPAGPSGPAGASGAVTIGENPPSSPTVGQQWFDSSDGSLYIYYNDGTSNQWVATSGPASVASTSSSWLEKNANYTVVAGEKLLVDCSGGAKTITLPVSANIGDEIRIIDATGNASTNNITVARNGHKIQGVTQDLTIGTDRAAFGLVYYNSTQGWLLTER